ncbi:MAG: hypothetical protein M1830_006661 [Pleopsidium flavum]|nr:MAG: hypothetical protein M1830_006661 [Pleopsidium flavum]
MASVTAFRTVFVASGSRRSEEKHRGPSDSMRQRLKIKLKSNRRDGAVDQEDLPTIPRATLTGMRTFIRRNNRPVGETTVMRSEYDFLEDDYHAVRKGDQGIYVKREWTAQSHRPSASLNNSSTRGASII